MHSVWHILKLSCIPLKEQPFRMQGEPFEFKCCLELHLLPPIRTAAAAAAPASASSAQPLQSYGFVITIWDCDEIELGQLREYAEVSLNEAFTNVFTNALTRNKAISSMVSCEISCAPFMMKENAYSSSTKIHARPSTPPETEKVGVFMTFLNGFFQLLTREDYKFCGVKEEDRPTVWKGNDDHILFMTIALRRVSKLRKTQEFKSMTLKVADIEADDGTQTEEVSNGKGRGRGRARGRGRREGRGRGRGRGNEEDT